MRYAPEIQRQIDEHDRREGAYAERSATSRERGHETDAAFWSGRADAEAAAADRLRTLHIPVPARVGPWIQPEGRL
ncbi:hypothetical protein JUN65_08345 [Gluconacetobacter azotocaptans]|uniref:hypothetical protein n=1 Tax=Gluconacetobacter azotocaptans TaxID=142834 RepID=UPI00195E4A7C|nr:hypothetical protein [Gluconacetobacter azotocaptans]MBM9401595.1 hypothetical protein [Gluconacetobacter azotocaptans]